MSLSERLFPVHKSTCLHNRARAQYIPFKKEQELWPSLRYLFAVATRAAVFPAAPKPNVSQENVRPHHRAAPLRWFPFTPHMPPGSVTCKVAPQKHRAPEPCPQFIDSKGNTGVIYGATGEAQGCRRHHSPQHREDSEREMGHPWEIPERRKEMKTSRRRTVWNSCTNDPNLKKSRCF